jgi:hypothetical protein
MPKRKDTKLESEGAEFLVLGHLLIEGVHCYKTYVNFPGYDLQAVNPNNGKIAKIQVKSRWATDYDKSFPLKNFNCNFVVHVALNRGNSFRKRAIKSDPEVPVFFVLPIEEARKALKKSGGWSKVRLNKIPKSRLDFYRGNWQLIRDFLEN